MSYGVALALVGVSILCHASWNLLAKRAGAAGTGFVAAWSMLAAVIWAPLGVWTLANTTVTRSTLVTLAVALCLHSGYFLLLQRGYRAADLSVVYPVARGTGPLLSSVLAVLLLHERPGLLGWGGIVLLCISVAVIGALRDPLTGAPERRRIAAGIGYGLAIGMFIAGYTLWDKHALTAVAVPAVLINWGTDTGRAVLLAPWLSRDVWRRYRREIIGTAVLAPGAYILFLLALSVAPVTSVAPLREISVVIAVALSARFLGERDAWRRLVAACGVVIGAVAAALSR